MMFKRLSLAVIGLLLTLSVAAKAQGGATVEAMLIRASNGSAPLDYRLDRVVPKLRKIFQFQSYELISLSSVGLTAPGQTSIALGKGHSIDIVARREGGKMKAEVRWIQGGKTLLSTGVTLAPNQPVILGGVPDGSGGTLIVALTAK